MDRVLEVNEKFAYAVVEPGMTFTGLYDYITAKKLKVWPSVASVGWGSVMGNTLDLGMGFGPTAMHHEHISGMEVMLADGSLLMTGQWAKSGSMTAHLSQYTFGPSWAPPAVKPGHSHQNGHWSYSCATCHDELSLQRAQPGRYRSCSGCSWRFASPWNLVYRSILLRYCGLGGYVRRKA